MIDVHGLPGFVRRKKSGKSLSVVNAFALDLLSADGKTPLPFNYQMMLIGGCMLVRTAYKRRSGEYCHDDFRFHVILYYKDDYLFLRNWLCRTAHLLRLRTSPHLSRRRNW